MADTPTNTTPNTDTSAAALAAGTDNFNSIFDQLVKDEAATEIKGPANVTADDYTSAGEGGGEGDRQGAGEADGVVATGADAEGVKDESGEAEGVGEGSKDGLPTPEQVAADAAKAAAETKKTETKVEQPGPTSDAWKTFDEIMKGLQKDKAIAQAEAQRQQQQEEEQRRQQQQSKGPEYTEEEKQYLKTYRDEWGDISRAEELIRREEYKARDQFLIGYMMEKYITPMAQEIQALRGQSQQQVQNSAYTMLKGKVPDYDEVAPKVVEWVKGLPPVYKEAYARIAKEGTIDDVVTMIDHYRAATGTAAPKPADAAAAAVAAAGNKPPATAKQMASLKAPTTRRSSPPTQEVERDDFPGAFDAFAKEEV